MAARKTTKVVLASRYSLRRGKPSDARGGSAIKEEADPQAQTSLEKQPLRNPNKQSRQRKRKSVAIKLEPESEYEVPTDQITGSPECESEKTPVKVAKSEVKTEKGDVPHDGCAGDGWFPPNWELALNNIRKMRKEVVAPVDSMGCDQCHDITTSPVIQRYQILVSLMLSSQTKDQVTYAAMGRLRKHGLTPENILKTDTRTLEEIIKPVGFYKRKSEYIKKASQILLDEYNGDIPDTVDKLCKLPGVGPKMAHICMSCAWNVVSGIGVDTHVHRISQRIGWLPPNLKKKGKNLTPEDTRVALESWLPKPLWSEVNHLLKKTSGKEESKTSQQAGGATMSETKEAVLPDASKIETKPAGFGTCENCQAHIKGQAIHALGHVWHPEHFVCAACKKPISGQTFNVHEGKPFCEQDYSNKFLQKCRACGLPIKDVTIQALGASWHREHFVCKSCATQLAGQGFFEKENNPFCQKCFENLFSPKCAGCNNPITETAMMALGKNFHPGCFKCSRCKTAFDATEPQEFKTINEEPFCVKCGAVVLEILINRASPTSPNS